MAELNMQKISEFLQCLADYFDAEKEHACDGCAGCRSAKSCRKTKISVLAEKAREVLNV